MTDICLDIETLSTQPNAVVLTLGCVKFDPYSDSEPHSPEIYRLTIDDQAEKGRHIDQSTLAWWAKQPEEIQEDALGDTDRIQVVDFMAGLNKCMTGVDRIWCQGPQFDMVILEDLFKSYNHHTNWKFWQVMDCRTLFNLMPKDPRKAIQQKAHNALADAYFQAICIQQSIKHFNMRARR